MKSKSKKSMVNFATSIFYKIVLIAVGLILPKMFITGYGSQVNGLQNSIRQIFTYIALLEAGIGASTVQSLFKSVAKKDRKQSNAYLSAAASYYNKIGWIYFVALTVISGIYCFTVSVDTVSRWQVFLYVLVSGAVTGINFFYIAKIKLLISAEGDEYLVSLITTITFTLASAIKILMIYAGVNIVLLEGVYNLIQISVTVVYYAIAKHKYPWLSFKEKPDFTGVEQKNSVMVHRITSVIFQNTDVILLTFFCDLNVVSIYSMYKMVVNMVNSVVGSFGDSVNFVLGQQFNSEEDEKHPRYQTMIDTFNVYYSAISFALFTITYILMIPFLKIYTAKMDINYIYLWMPVLYIIIEFLTVGREAMMRTINVAGHFKKTQGRAVLEAVINLVTSVVGILVCKAWFGNIGGLYGALFGTIAALLYRTIDINIYANRHILHRGFFKTFGIMGTNMVIFFLVSLAFSRLMPPIDGYLPLLLHAVWISVVVLILFLIVQSAVNGKECKTMLSFAKKKLLRQTT